MSNNKQQKPVEQKATETKVDVQTETTTETTTATETAKTEPTTETKVEPNAEKEEANAPANETVVADSHSDLAPHQRLELRAFGEMLDEYATRYEYKDQAENIDRAAHRKLHASIRMLLSYDSVVMKEAYAMLLNRMATKHKFNAFGLPIITKYLHDSTEVKSSSERVFLSEFLSVSSQFARTQEKTKFRSQANLKKVLQSISDDDVRKRVDSLFPGA